MNTRFHTSSNALYPTCTIRILLLPLAFLFLFAAFQNGSKASAAGNTTYYLDCLGKDSNSGKSPSQAWQSIARANNAPLVPGDRLLSKRGCTWSGTLKASWNGTATQPILIGAYGTGELPKIQNGPGDLDDKYFNSVDITGSHQIIEYLEATIVNPPVDPGCQNNPVGFYVGFNFRNPGNLPDGGAYNLLRNAKASRHMAGAHLATNTHHNRILRNIFSDNHVMNILTPTSVGSNDDIGAWGVVLKGSNQEVAYNYFSNNNAWCSYDTSPQGNSIELFEARDNFIHHNTSVNDRVFSELGGSPALQSDNNSYVYNLVISSIRDARFIVARGDGNGFGPTFRTKLYHNTVYYTGTESQGIVCGAGCKNDILTAKNNIIWAEEKAAFADAQFNEGANIYWSSSGTPHVQFQNFNMSATSMIVNPQFVNPANGNLRLKPTSPAIDAGVNCSWDRDLDNRIVPQGGGNDIGAFEYNGGPALKTTPKLLTTINQHRLYLPLVEHLTMPALCS